MGSLNSLPPPPPGQTGITLDQFSHLAPPPPGQTGLTLTQIQAQQPTIGSAGQTVVPGSSFFQNLKALPGQIKDVASRIAPAAGAIVGGLGGAAAGTLVAPGPGTIAGGAAGAAIGGAAGEAASETLDKQPLEPGTIAKTGAEYGALDAVGGPIAGIAGKVLKNVGEGVAKAFIPLSKQEAGYMQAYKAANPLWKRLLAFGGTKAPQTAAKTAFDQGLMGSESMIGIQARRATSGIWNNVVSPALHQSTVQVDMPAFFSSLETQIKADTPELSRQKSLLTALDALKEDYTGIESVPLGKLQSFKEGWAQLVPDKAYQGKPIAGAFRTIQNLAAKNAREVIYQALGPNVRQAYLDYGNLKSLQELGKTAMAGSKFKGGAGRFLTALKESALVPAGTIGGQTIYKVGRGLEFVGSAGLKNLRSLLGLPAGFGGYSDQASTSQS